MPTAALRCSAYGVVVELQMNMAAWFH